MCPLERETRKVISNGNASTKTRPPISTRSPVANNSKPPQPLVISAIYRTVIFIGRKNAEECESAYKYRLRTLQTYFNSSITATVEISNFSTLNYSFILLPEFIKFFFVSCYVVIS